MSYPPEVRRYFEQQKREQQVYVNTAHIKKNLRETTIVAINAMDKLIQRGTQLEMVEEEAEQLQQTSKLFLVDTLPWWKFYLFCNCLPTWWCKSE